MIAFPTVKSDLKSDFINNFVLHVATVNGSGSQSANQILLKSLFHMGLRVGGKNLFPSNIAGLATWFTIRLHPKGYTGRRAEQDILVAMNPATLAADLKGLKTGGFLLYNSEIKIDPQLIRRDVFCHKVPFRDLVESLSSSVKLKKLLVNMVYVGILSELLHIPKACSQKALSDQFSGKESVIETNLAAFMAGADYAREHLSGLPAEEFPYRAEKIPLPTSGSETSSAAIDPEASLLMDGNAASAIGAVAGGCSFASWYPITPSSSLMEGFTSWAEQLRDHSQGKTYAVIQAEDEIAALCMVIGAGWVGARAMTATSGPGLSLMAEAAGLAYYAEIPAVVFNVQRAGPSTGLPTRTLQGDILAAAFLSHGDTRHVLLFPGDIEECFEFARISFDLAERLQTLVIVLSDLDLGMNLHLGQKFPYPTQPFDRGKIVGLEDLEKMPEFARYRDVDGDGICHRSLPLTEHPKAAYFTRGTGHDEKSGYSEDPEVFRRNLERLKRKFDTAKELVPKALRQSLSHRPQSAEAKSSSVALIAYGSSAEAMHEVLDSLVAQGLDCDYLRLRAYPFGQEVEEFLTEHNERETPLFVIEQNRDAQMLSLLKEAFPRLACRSRSILQFDGLPLEAQAVAKEIQLCLEVQP